MRLTFTAISASAAASLAAVSLLGSGGCSTGQANTAQVCLASNFKEATGLTSITLPKLTVFGDGGESEKAPSEPWNAVDFKASTVNPNAAIVTDEPVRLSVASPCVTAPVRMLAPGEASPKAWQASDRHVWDLDHAMGKPPMVAGQPSHVGDAQLHVRAVLLGDVSKWTEAKEEDVAAVDPNNPMSHLDADKAAASSLPLLSPNLEVCLSHDVDGDGLPPVTLPKGLVFQSGGKASGDRREPGSDPDSMSAESSHYAVVLVQSVKVSASRPCASAVAQTALSDANRWSLPLVRRTQTLQFQAYGVEGHLSPGPGDGRLSDLIVKGVINARPSGDIGNPRQLASDS